MRNRNISWTIAVTVFLLLAAMWGFAGTPVLAQSTATSTPTATATNTPTATATPIMTQVPLVSNPSGLYYGYGIGNYGAPTPVTSGSAFQSSVGDIDLYSAAGQRTFHVDHATGNMTAYGNITATGSISASGTSNTFVSSSATVGLFINCANSNVTGSLTATPVSGATPVGNPIVSLALLSANVNVVSGAYNAGTFTISAASVISPNITPASNTTPVAVEWCYLYNK